MFVTKRHLLVWETAAQAHANGSHDLGRFLGAMVVSPLSAVAAAVAIVVGHPSALPVAAPLLGFWLVAPFVAGWLSRPLQAVRTELPAAGRAKLRRLARKTWRYFDTFMREEHHDLPPDNYQEAPVEVVASRTSPTNIGMGLVSTMAAFQLGIIPARRCRTSCTGRCRRWSP
jgi:cyclic beta-1,2-glucan synthetase